MKTRQATKRLQLEHSLISSASERPSKKVKSVAQTPAAVARINEVLPIEILLMIFEKLTLQENVMSCAKTCTKWREIIALFVLRSKILGQASICQKFKRDIKKDGWTEKCYDVDVIMSLYAKFINRTCCKFYQPLFK